MFKADEYHTQEEADEINKSLVENNCSVMLAFDKCMVHGYGNDCPTVSVIMRIREERRATGQPI